MRKTGMGDFCEMAAWQNVLGVQISSKKRNEGNHRSGNLELPGPVCDVVFAAGKLRAKPSDHRFHLIGVT